MSDSNTYNAYKRTFMMVKITCCCGKEVVRANLSHHKKTQFHRNYVENKLGWISDPEEYDRLKMELTCRRGF